MTVTLPMGADHELATEDVSFTVDSGGIVCVVGNSSGGKSVTALAVMGLNARPLHPTAGCTLLSGLDLLRYSTRRLRRLRGAKMATLFQAPLAALNPVLAKGARIGEVPPSTAPG